MQSPLVRCDLRVDRQSAETTETTYVAFLICRYPWQPEASLIAVFFLFRRGTVSFEYYMRISLLSVAKEEAGDILSKKRGKLFASKELRSNR